jgi:tRNA (guanine37-N1)-methyltransferase
LLLNVSSHHQINEGLKLRKRLRQTFQQLNISNGLVGVYNAFDIVGDIAIIRMSEFFENSKIMAQAILNRNKNIKTVLAQTSSVEGKYRLRKLEYVAGVDKTRTIHKESACSFSVDVSKCYFSPRLIYERQRIAKQVKTHETVVNMFAGVGCFSIIIAKNNPSARIFSIDINPEAYNFMKENIYINKVCENVIPLLGDSKRLIPQNLECSADRILMPLPEEALEYIPLAISALKRSEGWIHFQSFEHALKTEDPLEKSRIRLVKKLESLNVNFLINFSRVLRTVGPNWHQVVVDVAVRASDKFNNMSAR